jgi:hypothetical protein
MSLEAILLARQGAEDKNEYKELDDFGETLWDFTGFGVPQETLEFLFKNRKVQLKELLKMDRVISCAPGLFVLLEPYCEIFYIIHDYFPDQVLDIISRFRGSLTPKKINSWFSRLHRFLDQDHPKLAKAKNAIMALLNHESVDISVGEVLVDFIGTTDDSNNQTLLGKGHCIPHQMDIGFIYVRECYKSLFIKLTSYQEKGPVLISGDPGIGKSYFGLYVFCQLAKSERNKVVRFTLSGDWIEFDGTHFYSGYAWSNCSWRDKDTWLLLDGNERVEMLGKRSRVVLFASPQQHNYHNFMKQSNTVCYYMPEWPLDEINNFVTEVCSKDVSPFIHLEAPIEQTETNPSENKGQPEGKGMDVTQIKERVLGIVKERYELVGGRIRDILASGISTAMLSNKLWQAVRSLRFEEVSSVLGVQGESNFPSIVYKITPDKDDPRLYTTGLCSKHCGRLIVDSMARQRDLSARELFSVFSRVFETKASSGLLFEALCLRELGIGASFDYREFIPNFDSLNTTSETTTIEQNVEPNTYSLVIPLDSDQSTTYDKLGFGDKKILIKRFDKRPNLPHILHQTFSQNKERDIYILLIPTSHHQEPFNSLVIDIQQKILYLFQVTVAEQHKLNLQTLAKCKRDVEENLGIELLRTEFVFMVPNTSFASYGINELIIKDDTNNYTEDSKLKPLMLNNFLEKNPKIGLKVAGVDVMQFGESEGPLRKKTKSSKIN